MRILLTELQREIGLRFVNAIVGAVLFTLLGYLTPRIYFQYFDNMNHVYFSEPITFERKLFNKCDQITAVVKWHSDDNYNLELVTKINKLNPNGVITPIYQFPTYKSFTNKTDYVVYSIPFRLPCDKVDLKPGAYFIEGQYHYQVKGVNKIYSFITDQFSIVETPLVN